MPDVLNSWKDIAKYLGAGVRTVQRWETLGMPVYRARAGTRGPVLAYRTELDVWLHSHRPPQSESRYRNAHKREVVEQHHELLGKMRSLMHAQRGALAKLTTTFDALEKLHPGRRKPPNAA